MAQAETRMRTSSAAISGTGISRNCSGCVVIWAGADKTQACMAETEEILPLSACADGKGVSVTRITRNYGFLS
jgi:hypothetical protein